MYHFSQEVRYILAFLFYLPLYCLQCDMVYETVVDWEYEQKCSTSYEEECHGYGYHQECEQVSCQQIINQEDGTLRHRICAHEGRRICRREKELTKGAPWVCTGLNKGWGKKVMKLVK
jgi:hypothetical protein